MTRVTKVTKVEEALSRYQSYKNCQNTLTLAHFSSLKALHTFSVFITTAHCKEKSCRLGFERLINP